MSVILDVLKKLDREKSSRRSAAGNIALEILKPDPPRSGKKPLYFAAVGLTALATAAITYALMGFGFLAKSSPPPAKSPPALTQMVAPAPVLLESSRETRDETGQAPREVGTPADNKTPATSPGEKEAKMNDLSEKANPAPKNREELVENTPTPPLKAPDRSDIPLPSLKISAIIWYEDPSQRFAIINDQIIHEGFVIDQAKVVEITPNRVRFSHNGRPFEISVK